MENVAAESPIIRPSRKSNFQKRRPVIESSSDEEESEDRSNSADNDDDTCSEEDVEERAFSPRSRMSMTGIRPADFESDSSDSELEGSVHKSEQEDEFLSAKEDSAEENSAGHIRNISNTANADNGSFEKSKSNDFIDNSLPHSSSENEAAAVGYNNRTDLPRYSSHFMKSIKKQLSSTLFPNQESANVSEINSGSEINETEEEKKSSLNEKSADDSEIQIIENNNHTIDLLSSTDEDGNKENIADNKDTDKTALKEASIKREVLSKPTPKPLKQSTIPAILRKSLSISSTPKKPVKCVSQEFYNKEVRKLNELKSELENAQRLIGMIGKNLPDGGRQLELRIQGLQRDIEIKNNYIATFYIEDAPENLRKSVALKQEDNTIKSEQFKELQEMRKAAFKNEVPDWNELSAAVNDIKPIHTGKQGMATFNTQKSLTIDRLKVSY